MTQCMRADNAYGTETEAALLIAQIYGKNSDGRVAEALGEQAVGTFEVRAVECWPETFDPKTRYFTS